MKKISFYLLAASFFFFADPLFFCFLGLPFSFHLQLHLAQSLLLFRILLLLDLDFHRIHLLIHLAGEGIVERVDLRRFYCRICLQNSFSSANLFESL